MNTNDEITNKAKCTPIFSQKLCGILLTKGFVLQGMAENKKIPGKNVFYFVESPSLKAVIAEYVSARD